MRAVWLASLFIAGLLGAGGVRADVRLDYVSRGDAALLTRLEIAGSRLRADAGGDSVIVDSAADEMLHIDRDRRQYSRLDTAALENLAGVAGAVLDQAQNLLDRLPEDQRQAIEERLDTRIASARGADVKLVASGRHERVAGYDCEVYALRVDGVHDRDLCLAGAAALGFAAADRAAVRDAFACLRRVAARINAGGARLELPFAGLGPDRIPIRIVSYGNGKVSGSSTLKSIDARPLPAADFAVPAGYREQPFDPAQFAG